MLATRSLALLALFALPLVACDEECPARPPRDGAGCTLPDDDVCEYVLEECAVYVSSPRTTTAQCIDGAWSVNEEFESGCSASHADVDAGIADAEVDGADADAPD